MIIAFIKNVRSRLTLGAFLHALAWSLTGAAILALFAGLIFILKGYAVPHIIYPIAATAAVLATLTTLIIRRISLTKAAAKADAHFHLKDALTTSLEFQNKNEDIHQLQRKQTEQQLKPLDPKNIPVKLPRRLLAATILSITAASAIALVPPSPEIRLQQEQERITKERTREIKKQLEKDLEEWIKSLSDEEKEAVDPEKLRKWVKQLKETGDKREALRNYARLEQKIQKTIDALDQRKDEELLKKAGLKLEQATKADSKEVGKDLKNKKFKEAAEKIKEFKLSKDKGLKKQDPKTTEKLKQHKKPTKEELAKMREKLEKLRQLSKPLSQAAKNQAKNNRNNQNGQASDANPSQAEQDLAEMLENLDQDAEELEEWLDEQELKMERGDEDDWEEGDEDMEFFQNELDEDLDELRKRLRKMDARNKARQRLRSLSKSLGKAQSFASGKSQTLGLGKGGKKPGVGSSDSRRKEKDKLTDNGLFDKLKGQKGKGQSLKSLEEADSGTGTSKRRGEATERSYERQLNSFIERDDIPEEMKNGVKEYLKQVHENQPAPEQK